MSGHGDEGGGRGHERWLLTYADMITLLMALFIVMYALSNLDRAKYQQLSRSLAAILGAGGGSVTVIGQAQQGLQPVTEPLEGLGTQPGRGALAEQGQQAAKDPLMELGRQLASDLRPLGRFHVYATERGIIISLLGSALFESGEASIKPAAEPVLAAIASRLGALGNDISVEGSADDRPINTPNFPSNWELSSRRATEVVRHLVAAYGFDARRFITVGYGDVRPVFDNGTAKGQAGNRRVDIVVLRDRYRLTLGEEIGG